MSFSGLIPHFFLVLSNILLLRVIKVCLSTHLLKDISISSNFGQLWIKQRQTLMSISLCEQKYSPPLSEHQGAWLLDEWVYLICKKLPSRLPKQQCHLTFPFSHEWVPTVLNPHQHLVVWVFRVLAIILLDV